MEEGQTAFHSHCQHHCHSASWWSASYDHNWKCWPFNQSIGPNPILAPYIKAQAGFYFWCFHDMEPLFCNMGELGVLRGKRAASFIAWGGENVPGRLQLYYARTRTLKHYTSDTEHRLLYDRMWRAGSSYITPTLCCMYCSTYTEALFGRYRG